MLYAYRSGEAGEADHQALRAAFELQVPIVYFVGTRPGRYRPFYPCYVVADDPVEREVLVTKGEMTGPFEEREPFLSEDPIERRYAVREMPVRVHQARFRGRVIPAYTSQCAICRLKEVRLLYAAHIVSDSETLGEPSITNGLSLCAIHHRAFDENLARLVEREVAVSRRLLDDEDGPMLDLLEGFHQTVIHLPKRRSWRPDPERLATRYDRFLEASSA